MPLKIEGTRRLPVRVGLLVLLAAALVAVVAYLLASQGPAPAPTGRSHAAATTVRHTAAPVPVKSQAAASPAPTPLSVLSAEAFGPAGPGQGDYPQGASLAVDGNASTAWHTDWYAAANLNGQPGTGLMLDLGTTVTVSGVQLALGPAAGGTVQLRAGSAPALTSLPVVVQAAMPGGTFTLQGTGPFSARYLLLWFTQLPPDGAGSYQAFVYNVSVSGTA